MLRTTYRERRLGLAGLGSNMTRQMNAAHKASIDPKSAQKARGLQDAEEYAKVRKMKALRAKVIKANE